MKQAAITLLLAVVFCISLTHGLKHKLTIDEDSRGNFYIENFGFEGSGHLIINCTNVKTSNQAEKPDIKDHTLGFMIKNSLTESYHFLEEHENPSECLLASKYIEIYSEQKVPIESWDGVFLDYEIRSDAPGFYNVYFISCEPPGTEISFDLDLIMYNKGNNGKINYLPAGQSVEPTIFLFFFIAYLFLCFAWLLVYMRPGEGKRIFKIHYLMTALLLIKTLACVLHAIELYNMKEYGIPGSWGIFYFIIAGIKGIMLFLLIALIGSGWAFIKPFLSDRDKKIFLAVIPLQFISNIALIVIEATAPGSQGWFTWQGIFRILDIMCCIFVLVPIIWSIRHLKEAAQVDGKAKRNMEKLQLFRHFYLIVVAYIYFTRIIVYLLVATLRFRWTWVGVFVTELATMAFLVTTGYLFRPVADNPYLKVENNDMENDVIEIQMEELGGDNPHE